MDYGVWSYKLIEICFFLSCLVIIKIELVEKIGIELWVVLIVCFFIIWNWFG